MIRFAVIGTNKITDRFLDAAKNIEEFKLTAVYSRSKDKAEEFAAKHGAALTFDNLNELAESKEVEAVYVASPNSLHAAQSIMMLSQKKHVLCEKTIASNKRELEEMVKTAKENGVVLMEAMRSVYGPGYEALKESIVKLGTIRRATFQYC